MPKVVNVDSSLEHLPIEAKIFADDGIEFTVGRARSNEELAALAGDADGIVTLGYRFTRETFTMLPKLKVIVRYGIGVDNIDLEAATDADVVCCHIADYCVDEVANHAFALLLACNRKVSQLDRRLRNGQPNPSVFSGNTTDDFGPIGRLRGETIGLVALGNIAQGVAQRAKPFGLRVIAYDPFVGPAVADRLGVELVPLDQLLAQSDYISVHAPKSPATVGLIGASEIAMCKPGAYMVLTSRGGVVDEAALYDALVSCHLAGAGVDVWDPEPANADKPLIQLENVVGTPHFAFYSDASLVQLRERVAESAADVVLGYTPRWVANEQVLSKVSLAPSRR